MSGKPDDITPRLNALDAALDAVLTSGTRHRFTAEEARRGARKAGVASLRTQARVRRNKTHPSNIVNALAEAARDAEGCEPRAAALTWDQLKDLTKLDDDDLSEILGCLLLDKTIRSRDEGAGRFYFLPARVRSKLLRKRALAGLLKGRAA